MYKSSHINHLDRNELEHELDVRSFKDYSSIRMEDLRKKLRKFLRQEQSGSLPIPIAYDDENEVDICKDKISKLLEMFNLLVLPLENTDVPKLKRRVEALIFHTYQRIGRLGGRYEADRQELGHEIKDIMKRYEKLIGQSLRDMNGDSDKMDSPSDSEDKELMDQNKVDESTKTVNARPSTSSSEEHGAGLPKQLASKVIRPNERRNKDFLDDLKMRRKKMDQLILSDSETCAEEDVDRKLRKKKNKKSKKKKKTRHFKEELSMSSSSTLSSDENHGRNSRRIMLKRTPVRLWNLKFSGDDNTSVGAFLADVEDRRVANHMTFRELFHAAGELFTGSALVVYRSCRGRIKDWQGLETKLLYAFQDPDYDRRLMREIENRKQGAEETVTVYIAKMRSLFSRLTRPKSEEDMLDIIEENVLPEYQSALCLQNFRNVDELEVILRSLEKGRLRAQRYDTKPQRSLLEPDLAYKPRIKKDNIKVSFVESSNPSLNRSNHQRSKNSFTCWNCHKPGHVFSDCFKPKTMFCYGCGKENTTKLKCPSCSSKTTNNLGNSPAERQTSGSRSAPVKTKMD